jgi:hypothetical protein
MQSTFTLKQSPIAEIWNVLMKSSDVQQPSLDSGVPYSSQPEWSDSGHLVGILSK